MASFPRSDGCRNQSTEVIPLVYPETSSRPAARDANVGLRHQSLGYYCYLVAGHLWVKERSSGPTTVAGDASPPAEEDAGNQPNSVASCPPHNRHLLDPASCGYLYRSRVGNFLLGLHPVTAVVVSFVACVVLVAAALIGSGLVVAHFVAYDRVGHWDDHLNLWFARHRRPVWNRVSGDFTLLADTLGVISVAAVVTVVLLVRRWGRLALLLAAALTAELTVFLATNYLVARPRPFVPHLGSTPSTSSWPSGHVAATTVLYGGIAVLVTVATSRRLPRLTAWIVAFALITCVALSRIYRGDHHLTDTLAGLALGVAALGSAMFALRVWSAHVTHRQVTGSRGPAPAGSGRRRA